MNKFRRVFGNKKCSVIGMIHVNALPGTPRHNGNWLETLEKAKHEAEIYSKHKLDAVLIENMHDVPYVQDRHLGPETVACMARVANEVRRILPGTTPCGIQVLACGNRQALAVAKACDLQYIRAEGFVFGHVADEGYTDACAGELMRYRRQIAADDVLVLTDIKKKHSSHAITADVSLLETVQAAEFFLTDGVVLTGNSTGHAANPDDLLSLAGRVKGPLLIGSGVTRTNVAEYFPRADGVIVGSHFKVDGRWENELCEKAIGAFVERVQLLRQGECN